MTTKQIPVLVGELVKNQHAFEQLKSEKAQWVIENAEAAIAIFVDVLNDAKKRQPSNGVVQTITPIAKRTLTVFKTLKIGGVPKKELANKVAKSCEEVTDWAKDLMKQKAFVTADAQTDVDFVVLSIADLGFTSNPRTDAFMTKEFCKEWSEKHLDGQAIELCEPEDGPQLRIQYEDQSNGEVLWMAMERIAGSGRGPRVWRVGRDGDGTRWLRTYWTDPDDGWDLDGRVVFRLRKLPLPSKT